MKKLLIGLKILLGLVIFFIVEAHEKWLGTKPQWRWKVSHKKALEFAKSYIAL